MEYSSCSANIKRSLRWCSKSWVMPPELNFRIHIIGQVLLGGPQLKGRINWLFCGCFYVISSHSPFLTSPSMGCMILFVHEVGTQSLDCKSVSRKLCQRAVAKI